MCLAVNHWHVYGFGLLKSKGQMQPKGQCMEKGRKKLFVEDFRPKTNIQSGIKAFEQAFSMVLHFTIIYNNNVTR